jgi:hypothetical protein
MKDLWVNELGHNFHWATDTEHQRKYYASSEEFNIHDVKYAINQYYNCQEFSGNCTTCCANRELGTKHGYDTCVSEVSNYLFEKQVDELIKRFTDSMERIQDELRICRRSPA